MGHVTCPCHFQARFVVHRLGLAMIDLHAKSEISMFTLYEGTKGNEKCRNWELGVTQGHIGIG